ncbi:MAG: hypothetical protein WCC96_03835 [Rhodomicrobium sp.]
MSSLSLLRGIGQKLRFHPSSCPSPAQARLGELAALDLRVRKADADGRGDVVAGAAACSLSHWERAGLRGATLIQSLIAILFFAAFAATSAWAENELIPHPPKGRGEHCVRDNAFMRRYHMTMLKHQRDETVHEGVRGNDFSIAGCVDCHAVKGADGQPVAYDNPKHFCRSCHDYAAVSIDCFECHASKPGSKPLAAAAEPGTPGSTAMANYLQESHP